MRVRKQGFLIRAYLKLIADNGDFQTPQKLEYGQTADMSKTCPLGHQHIVSDDLVKRLRELSFLLG